MGEGGDCLVGLGLRFLFVLGFLRKVLMFLFVCLFNFIF